MAAPEDKTVPRPKRHRYFSDRKMEAFIAMVGGALIILAMLAVTLR